MSYFGLDLVLFFLLAFFALGACVAWLARHWGWRVIAAGAVLAVTPGVLVLLAAGFSEKNFGFAFGIA